MFTHDRIHDCSGSTNTLGQQFGALRFSRFASLLGCIHVHAADLVLFEYERVQYTVENIAIKRSIDIISSSTDYKGTCASADVHVHVICHVHVSLLFHVDQT